MGFEQNFSEIQADMISICLEYVENKADIIYIYVSYEENTISCNYFYKINSNLYKKHELPKEYDTSIARQKACLNVIIDDIKKMIAICEEYNTEMPTEIKIVYDVNKNKINASYQYENILSNTEKNFHDIVEAWYQEICR